jgi:hypothetical protein
MAANAQGHMHGGSGGHGFSHTMGGPGFRGGFRGGFHHFNGCCFGPGPFAFGLFLGLAASPWWYWGPDDWWGPYPPYGYGYDYDYPPPPPPPGAAAQPQACGSWVWGGGRYTWTPAPCPAAPAA